MLNLLLLHTHTHTNIWIEQIPLGNGLQKKPAKRQQKCLKKIQDELIMLKLEFPPLHIRQTLKNKWGIGF